MQQTTELVKYAIQLGLDEGKATLLVKETLDHALQMYEKGRIEQKGVKDWAYTTVRNKCYDHLQFNHSLSESN
jgi:DNA-directed RNA polymerase specialized sigma24 family protein